MRPAISDSLTSGHPLYLLNSNENCKAPLWSAVFAAVLATQATGRVRLQVTGRAPTIRGLAAAAEAGSAVPASAAASVPRSTWRRSMQCRCPANSGSIGYARRLQVSQAPRGCGAGMIAWDMVELRCMTDKFHRSTRESRRGAARAEEKLKATFSPTWPIMLPIRPAASCHSV